MKKIMGLGEFSKYIRELRKQGKLSMLKAIRLKCYDCSAYNQLEIERCDIEDCPLWEFRSGRARRDRRQVLIASNLMKKPKERRGIPNFRKKAESLDVPIEKKGDNL